MKKRTFAVSALCLSLLLSGCGSSGNDLSVNSESASENSSTDDFDLDNYKTLIAKCDEDILSATVFLTSMGSYQYNLWTASNNIGGTMTPERLVTKGREWLVEKCEISETAIDDSYDEICTQYKAILAIEPEGSEAEKLQENIDALFNSYNTFYNLVTNPSGSISTFLSDYRQHCKDIENYDSMLQVLLT